MLLVITFTNCNMVPVQWKVFQCILKRKYTHDDPPEVFLCTKNVYYVFELIQEHFLVMTVCKLLWQHLRQNQCFHLLSVV